MNGMAALIEDTYGALDPWYCECMVAPMQGGGPLSDTEEVPVGTGVGDNHVAKEPIQSFNITPGYPLLDTGKKTIIRVLCDRRKALSPVHLV